MDESEKVEDAEQSQSGKTDGGPTSSTQSDLAALIRERRNHGFKDPFAWQAPAHPSLLVLAATALIAGAALIAGIVMYQGGVGDEYVEGIVIRSAGLGDGETSVTVRYSMPGSDQDLTFQGSRNRELQEGARVKLYYDPQNPDEVSFTPASRWRLRGLLAMVGGGLVMVTGAGLAGYFWLEERRRLG